MAAGTFMCGVIEGFYGTPWSFESRLAYADYLAALHLNTFIYCPKADPYLRKRWMEDWPQAEWRQLQQLSQAYRQRGLNWGVGLSPYALYDNYGARERARLESKIARLVDLDAAIIAILFDDMPGDRAGLAARQAEIVADVCRWAEAVRIVVCPTYYAFDPVLEKHFGTMPAQYWPDLGRALPPGVGVFWTGNAVCADSVSVEDIERINRQLGRKVTLWDNYPVNDGAVRSNFLYLEEPAGRDPAIAGLLEGHLSNPMNQALLSLPAVAGLAALHGLGGDSEQWLGQVLGESTWSQIKRDRQCFRSAGLTAMEPAEREALAARYQQLGSPAAREVADWLRGEYTFDPACLTD